VEELAPPFERTTGHKLTITYGSTGPLKARIVKGEAFDVTVLGEGALDDLIQQGLLDAAPRAVAAKALLDYLASPDALRVQKAHGLEPPGRFSVKYSTALSRAGEPAHRMQLDQRVISPSGGRYAYAFVWKAPARRTRPGSTCR
jgi:ABC-type molybdate transport system substrate-binding protein